MKASMLLCKYRNGATALELLVGIAIPLIIAAVIISAYKCCSNWVDQPAQIATGGVIRSEDIQVTFAEDILPEDIHTVCIEKHEYVYVESRWNARAAMAPLFDDEGRPRKCRVETIGNTQ